MERFHDWRRRRRYGWQSGTNDWHTMGMAEQYTKEVVEPAVLDDNPLKGSGRD
jgi:hypothetical protein